MQDPQRTTRSTVGLLVGVTLVTPIASGMSSLTKSVHGWDMPPAEMAETERSLSVITAILLAMIAISTIIAAVVAVARVDALAVA